MTIATLAPALAGALGGAAAGGLAWGHFEAGWVRLETFDCELPRLTPELDGLRIVHLSDFHLGFPSRGSRAVTRALDWTRERAPDLVLITGDLLSRRGGDARLRELLSGLPNCFAVLGNHDYGLTRDPFSEPSAVYDLGATTVLADESRELTFRGRRVQLVGIDPRSYRRGTSRPAELVDPAADLRILLCHYPYVINRLQPGAFDLVLAGHLHAGQICLPWPGGRIPLAHLRWRDFHGLYREPAATLHVSAGLGTTFVPFRFLARPEATELRLRSGG